jgi:FMN reductase
MSLIVTLSGSPAAPSRTQALARVVGERLAARDFEVEAINVRDLDPAELLHGRVTGPSVAAALGLVERAAGIVIATPVYKAAYSGILKAFLDLLPQFGLAGKSVLPLATGGTVAHVLAIDYGLRPVLSSLGALHIVTGLFLLDKTVTVSDAGLAIDADVDRRLDGVIEELAASVRRHRVAA